MTFGAQMNEREAARAVDFALDAGVNMLDTANNYVGGRSEEILGRILAGKRDKVLLATKVGNQTHDGPNGKGLSRKHILAEVENSLKRLQTDRIDLYYLHTPDRGTPLEETLDAVDHLTRSGKILYFGVSNYAAWQIGSMFHYAATEHKARPAAAQMVYNMITRGIEQEYVPFAKQYHLGTIVYNPLAGGMLTDKYADKRQIENTRFSLNPLYAKRYWNEENLAAWDDIRAIAGQAGIPMRELALRWILSTGNADAILVGFSRMEQLADNLKSLDAGPLPADVMAACDGIWGRLSGTRFKYNR
jgi:aryl-alcohol dehydrogenase-like predicted oxidoreductase